VAEADSQRLLGPDASCAPALGTLLASGVESDRGLRWEPVGFSGCGSRVAPALFESPNAAPWAVGGRSESPLDDVPARSANPVAHLVPLMAPEKMVTSARTSDGDPSTGRGTAREDDQANSCSHSAGSLYAIGTVGLNERKRVGRRESPWLTRTDGSVAGTASPEGYRLKTDEPYHGSLPHASETLILLNGAAIFSMVSTRARAPTAAPRAEVRGAATRSSPG
jgi:hypothetical protein